MRYASLVRGWGWGRAAWGQEALLPWGLGLEKEAESKGFQAMGKQKLLGHGWCKVRGAEREGTRGVLCL